MKLFWRSIVFLAVASVAPLAFGQNTILFSGNQALVPNQQGYTGNYNDTTQWQGGVIPTGTANTGAIASFLVNNIETGNVNGFLTFNNPLTVNVANVSGGLSAQGLLFQGEGEFANTTQGVINIPLATGAIFTITGNNLTGTQDAIQVEDGVTANISGGSLNIQKGNIVVGDDGVFFGTNYTDGLTFSKTNVTIGSGISMSVGAGTSSLFGTTIAGIASQNQSSVTTGNSFFLQIGTQGTFGFGNGSYSLTNNSALSLGGASTIEIGTGKLSQDSNSTISLGSGSEIIVGTNSGDNANFQSAGNINLVDTSVIIGLDGSTGTFTQTSGAISGTASLDIGLFGTGSYLLSSGSGTFSQGITVGDNGGTGLIDQTGGSLTASGAFVTNVGVNGIGTYLLEGGSVDFQGGLNVGGLGILTQTGGTLSSEGATTISGTYTMAGVSATFANTLTVNGELDINSGTLTVGRDLLGGSGTINFGGGTLALTGTGSTGTTYEYNFAGSLVSGTSTIDVSDKSGTLTGTFIFNQSLAGAGGISLVGNGNTDFYFADLNPNAPNASLFNTYQGSTGINGGTLFATQADLQSSNALTVGATGTLNLTLDPNGVGMAITGPINGTGTIALQFNSTGTQTFVMPNANGFDGTVALGVNGNAGTLQIYNGTFENITDNGTSSSVTIGGTTVLDSTVPTSGTVFLPGANSYTGLTTVNSGFTVAANQFHGDVSYSGALATSTYPFAAGTSSTPSTMTIAGTLNAVPSNLLGAAPPTLLIFTNGTTADTFLVNNNGNAADTSTISGLISVKGSGTGTYDVVQATTGTLTLGTVSVLPAGSLYSYQVVGLVNNDKDLEIQTTQNTLSTFAQTPAQKAVAGSLDPLTQSPPPSFAPLLTIFNNMSASQIPIALGQLSTQSLQFSRNIAFENSTYLVQRLDGVLADMRSGYAGLDLNSITCTMPGFDSGLGHSMQSMFASNAPSFHTTAPNGVNYYPDGGSTPSSTPSSDYDQPVTPSSRMTPSQAASPTTYDGQVLSDSPVPMGSAPPSLKTSRFSEFVAGDVVLADINQNAMQDIPSKATYTSGDISAGVAYRMTSNLSVGVLLDYNHTNATTDGNGSKTTVNSITPGIYATFFEKGFYANGLFAFGFNNYNNSRNVSFLGGTANSSPTGQQYTANIDFGYDFHPDRQWVVGPTLGLTYTHLDIDSFSETGVPLANLNVNSQSLDSLRSRLGGHVEYMTRVGSVILQPSVTAMWQHEFLDDGAGITSSWQAFSASPFTTPMAATTTDSALLGCGLTATLDNSMAFFLSYLADVGGSDYLSQSIVGGVKASF